MAQCYIKAYYIHGQKKGLHKENAHKCLQLINTHIFTLHMLYYLFQQQLFVLNI